VRGEGKRERDRREMIEKREHTSAKELFPEATGPNTAQVCEESIFHENSLKIAPPCLPLLFYVLISSSFHSILFLLSSPLIFLPIASLPSFLSS
jgi:hypothetical protein